MAELLQKVNRHEKSICGKCSHRFVCSGINNQPCFECNRFTEEVVRCKDCKYFVQGEPYDPCECMKWMVKFGVAYTTPDGYCHKAERKNENM